MTAQAWPDNRFDTVDACLWCGSGALTAQVDKVEDWFFRAVPGSFAFARCGDCASLMLTQRPRQEFFHAVYDGYYTREAARPRWRKSSKQKFDSLLIRAMRKTRGRPGLLARLLPEQASEARSMDRYLPLSPCDTLDYGCGDGGFVAQASERGHRARGLDFDPAAIAAGRARGLDLALVSEVPASELEDSFDHISLVHVAEHVADPVDLMGRLARWLRPGGQLYCEVPHAHGGGLLRYGRFWRGLEAPRHFSVPSSKALEAVMQDAGLAIDLAGYRTLAQPMLDAASREAGLQAGVALPPGDGAGEPDVLVLVARKC